MTRDSVRAAAQTALYAEGLDDHDVAVVRNDQGEWVVHVCNARQAYLCVTLPQGSTPEGVTRVVSLLLQAAKEAWKAERGDAPSKSTPHLSPGGQE
jgi:predicted metal-dependent peptidase